MNRKELVQRIFEKVNDEGLRKKDVEVVLRKFEEAVKEALADGDEIRLVGFGTFKVIKKKEKVGRNPQTGERIRIPAMKAVKFVMGKEMKRLLNT